jgi:FlaA1/EpsC-like NDP-sugar epimerase
VETLFHAAAFKHVELIERNVAAGVENNTFGTAVLAQAAAEAGVGRFTMVSTSEAEQPVSMVASSLRLAEMVVQALAAQGGSRIAFSAVRFGATIDGPGSLMDRLRQEIEAGGPVCLSHADATCHCVSEAEAAELIIQAGALARGGEVFALDMGERLRVEEIARSMIECVGLTVRDDVHHVGEIAFDYVGSEGSEALREQQEAHHQYTATEHLGILDSGARQPGSNELKKALEELRDALQTGDPNAIRTVLYSAVGAPLAARRQHSFC